MELFYLDNKNYHYCLNSDTTVLFLHSQVNINIHSKHFIVDTEIIRSSIDLRTLFTYTNIFGIWHLSVDKNENYYFVSNNCIKKITIEHIEQPTIYYKYLETNEIILCGDEEELYFIINNVFYKIKKTLINPWSEPFNGDIIIGTELLKLINIFNVKHIIETGTSSGETTKFLTLHSPNITVHSIEIIENTYNIAKHNLSSFKKPYDCRKNILGSLPNLLENYNINSQKTNYKLHLGSSVDILPNILSSINEITLFYLDAHWETYWPLNDEIMIIGKYLKDKAIIVIDDFQVPNKNYCFDSYNSINCNFEFIEKALSHAFTDYVYYYNDISARIPFLPVGKIYIIPKSLLQNFNIKNDDLFVVKNNIPFSII